MGNKRIYLGRLSSKYAKIAGGAIITVTSLFFVLMVMGFEITGSDDICLGTEDDPCVSYGKICNLGPDNYDIYNPDEVALDFSPTVKNYWMFFKDGRVKKNFFSDKGINFDSAGWRYENFTNATKPRSDRVYVHRFARYSCQEYMLVGLKENSEDIIKWGMGVGREYFDPFWYAESPVTYLELGSDINITTNITGAAGVCVDIDHPEYGDNYTCGSPSANFTFNISYFRNDEFNDSSTIKTITLPTLLNDTCDSGCTGGYISNRDFESCMNISINKTGTLRVDVDLRTEWGFGDSDPIINIRDNNTTLLETHQFSIDSVFTNGEYSIYSDNIYSPGVYGFCLKHTENGEEVGFFNGDHIVGSPSFIDWPSYGVDPDTGDIISNTFSKGHETHVYSTSDTLYVDSHSYDDVVGLSINITGIELSENVRIFVNNTLTNSLGFVYNTTEGNISDVTISGMDLININSTTFSIPKTATILNTTINFTGVNITWGISDYSIPETAYGELGSPSIGTPAWLCASGPTYCDIPDNAWDGNIFTQVSPYLIPTYDSDYTAFIYENYTIDTDYIFGNWSAFYQSGNTIVFVQDCFNNVSWISLISDTDEAFIEPNIVPVPDICLSQSFLQVRTTLQYAPTTLFVYTSTYADGFINYYRYGFPESLRMEVGIPDGSYEYFGGGELTGSDGATGFGSSIEFFLSSCTADSDGFCEVPIYFISSDGGHLTIDNLEILYKYDPNPVVISTSILQSYLNSSSIGTTTIPLIFSGEGGSFNISDLRYDYAGGNDTINITTWEIGNSSNNETLSLNVYFSKFINLFPSFIEFLEFIPRSYIDEDVEPYGQSSSRPIFNLTTYNYGGKDANYSVYMNGSNDCVNITLSNTNNKSDGFILNDSWIEFNTSIPYLSEINLWMWADLSCNYTSWKLFNPGFYFRGCCEGCICSEDLS